MTRRVYSFEAGRSDGDPERKDILGGKGASLAAMSRAGLPVPPGFTISAECCRPFLDAGGNLPDQLVDEVRAALRRLEQATGRTFGRGEKPLLVSVRSGAAVSMPGMMDTILNCGLDPARPPAGHDARAFWEAFCDFVVMFGKAAAGIAAAEFRTVERGIAERAGRPAGPLSADELRQVADAGRRLYADRTRRPFPDDPWQAMLRCIEAVFASWNNERAAAYRQRHGLHDLAGTAVTVQAMFPAEVSGVAFTVNPNAPDAEEMVIESSYGLGEAIVSGDVHPDSFTVDRKAPAVKHQRIGHKAHVVAAFGDTARRDPDAPSLDAQQVAELAGIALRVEEFFGRPVDIEWGLAGRQWALLQARPIRTLEEARARAELLERQRSRLRGLADAGCGPWVLHNLGETVPHPTPLTWSVLGRFMSGSGGFGEMYRAAGFEPSERLCREGFCLLIAGKVYMDASLAPEMFFRDYPFRYDLDLLRARPDAAQAPPTLPSGSIAAKIRAARLIAAANRRIHRIAADLDVRLRRQTIPQFVEWCRREKQQDLADLSPAELVQAWRRRCRRVMDEFAPRSLLPSLVTAMALAELRQVLAENFWDDDPDELANALSAPPEPDMTIRANADLFAVARGERSLEQWLADNGHRAAEEFDLASPRWHEVPQEVEALAARLRDGTDPMRLHRARVARVGRQVEQLRSRLHPPDRRRLDAALRLVRRYIPFREDAKHYLMLGYDLLRDVALEAGRRLGIGRRAFLLTFDELADALAAGDAPRELIARREATHRAEQRVVLPPVIDAEGIDSLGRPARAEAADSYHAQVLSTGTATGPARIVRSPVEAGDLGSGYVLVCSSTDPAWTPLFVNAAGLVLECGGALSHGALVAREMGIPAVVLPAATAIFTEGEALTVDGHHGTVGRAAEPAAPPAEDDPGDVVIPPGLVPPPPGRRERAAGRARNACLLAWGAYLLAVAVLPAEWLYRPSLALLDGLLWPLVVAAGRPGAVAIVAAALAVLTMVGQRFLTDNRRLRQAKRRAARLAKAAAALPRSCPRRLAIARLTAPVHARTLGAAFVPLAILLGPMIMAFVWFRGRVDVASWNAPAGTAVSVVAAVDSNLRTPVTCSAQPPLRLDELSQAAQTLPPIRETLRDLLDKWRSGSAATRPWEVELAAGLPQATPDALEAYLRAGVPPQNVMWKLRPPPDAAGRFAVTVTAGDAAPVSLNVVLGDRHPPAPSEARGAASSPIRSVRIVYPSPGRERVFWAPLAFVGKPHWDAGWLLTYLIAYLPVMYLLRWLLKVA